ncbi:MAG: hypothetical protein K6E33_07340, partial [Lachnospiraceae bacterium]|nr:hypothetical protein [Lachnospiraceae bacterium]
MDKSILIGEKILHKSLGEGVIISIEDNYVKVVFDGDSEKEFQFPQAFFNLMQFEKETLQSIIMKEKELKEKDLKSVVESVTQPKQEKIYKAKVLEKGEGFATHAEALNECLGSNYKHFQQAYKVIDDDYAVWFPNIAVEKRGEYVSTDKTLGWVNILTEKGTVIIQRDQNRE